MIIELKTVPEHKVVYIYQIGSYEKIFKCLETVIEWINEKDLKIKDPIYSIYYNSPLEVSTEELEWEVGSGFEGKMLIESEHDEVQIQIIPEHKVVSTIFKGPYGEASSVYVDLYYYTAQNNLKITGPVKEIYLNNPINDSEDKLKTEVQFPVI
ncbi:MAG: GyrI-like domain-containing protein [Methanobacteriaceae archaeon]|nr:GyrI-like domain-containing protein [Methanobacteriaceae archaeon]